MCSNCSGDDLKPESFALFDVSSPAGNIRFARAEQEKRKRYRTGRFFMRYGKAALTLAIQTVAGGSSQERITGSVDRGSFVNLNLSGSCGEYAANSRVTRNAETLIEIRVSSDAIIEVFSNRGSAEESQNAFGLSEQRNLSAWEECYVHRNNLRRTLGEFRRIRRLKYFLACGAFVTAAALAVWCAVR
jgi:hypothetical protein